MELMASTMINGMDARVKPDTSSQRVDQSQQSDVSGNKAKTFKSTLNEKSFDKRPNQGLSKTPKNIEPRGRQVAESPNRYQNSAHRELDPNQQKYDQSAKKSAAEEAVDSLTRRAALQSFIRKMKQDLNVNPSEIVSALMKLSPDQMKLPPKMNVDSIINQLSLDPVAKEKATIYFDQMLAESSANSIADYLKGSSRQLSLEVMSQSEQRQRNVERSIDSMNDQFFAGASNEAGPASAKTAEQGSSVDPVLAGFGLLGGAAASMASLGGQAAGQVGGQASQVTAQSMPANFYANSGELGLAQHSANRNALNAQGMNQVSTQQLFSSGDASQGMALPEGMMESPAAALEKLDMLQAPKMATAASTGLAAYGLSKGADVTSAAAKVEGVDTSTFNFSGADIGAVSGDESSQTDSSSAELFSGDSSDQQAQMDGAEQVEGAEDVQFTVRTQGGEQRVEGKSSTSSQFQVSHEASDAEQAKNVKDIMEQTQLLMKKGGGEAKVTLNPEGLGQINLKVVTEGDQVSVDMVAESNEAKKLIEKGLGDLKATLASHKLNVENMKVDLAGEIAKQFDHAHDEAQRQSAQNFMENFRQQNGAWRQSFFDVPGVRAPRSQSEDGLQLESLEQRKKADSSRRLDLVA